MQDRIDVAVGLGERRRETRLDLDPPAFCAQPGCHLDEEAGPSHGIVVGKDDVAACVRRKRIDVLRGDCRQPAVGSGKPLSMLAFQRAVAFDGEQAAVFGEQRAVALIVGRHNDRSVGEGEARDLKILGRRGCRPGRPAGVARESGLESSSRELQNGRRRAGDDLRGWRFCREQFAVPG